MKNILANSTKYKYWIINFVFSILNLTFIIKILNCLYIHIGTDNVRDINFILEIYNNGLYYNFFNLFILWYLINSILARKNITLLIINYLLIAISVVYIKSKIEFFEFYYFDYVKNFELAIKTLKEHPNIIRFYKLINILIILNTIQLVINLIPSLKNFKEKYRNKLYKEIEDRNLIIPIICFVIFIIIFIYYFEIKDLFF